MIWYFWDIWGNAKCGVCFWHGCSRFTILSGCMMWRVFWWLAVFDLLEMCRLRGGCYWALKDSEVVKVYYASGFHICRFFVAQSN